MAKYLYIILTIFFFIGCSNETSNIPSKNKKEEGKIKTAQLKNIYVEGIEIKCGKHTTFTDANGAFTYNTDDCDEIKFKMGQLDVVNLRKDNIIYPCDILGLDRKDKNNSEFNNMLVILYNL